MIDFYASWPQYIDHLAPIWNECKRRKIAGRFLLDQGHPALQTYAINRGIAPLDLVGSINSQSKYILASGTIDLRTLAGLRIDEPVPDGRMGGEWNGRKIAYIEHGVGLSFCCGFAGYPGGHDARDIPDLFLMPNERAGHLDRESHPNTNVVVCGSPKMDAYAGHIWDRHCPPVIGYATHFDDTTIPEARSSFPFYKESLQNLAEQFNVIAHTHPCSPESVWQEFEEIGLETERDMPTLFDRVDLLVCDVGSAPYEFAATNRPVVICNCPLYRKDISHGLRFWEDIPGVQVDEPNTLTDAVKYALDDPGPIRRARRDIIESIYPYRGESTKRAVDALEAWSNGDMG